MAASVALLVSCAAQAPVSEAEGTAAAGYGRVFGRVHYSYNGAPTELGLAMLGSHDVTLFVRQAGSDQMQYLKPQRDGTFSWPLKAGDYVLVGLAAGRTAGSYRENTTRRYMAPIALAEAGTALYIGDIRVQSRGGRYNIDVVDEYDETLRRMQPQLEGAKFRPVKALMQPERPPGNYKRVQSVCAAAWQLACSDTHQGVEIVAPVGPGMTFPSTESLTPVLEWKPSPRKDVTYDVVVYESLTFAYGFGDQVNRLLGGRVAYAEGLTEPRFVPPTALQPGKKYEWSVRLRDGDTVSSWSTTSFSLNLLVAGRRESGRLFAFETPEK
ncbi:MAG TPA: hypothetical protein VFK84_13600 [Burkholderiales bacterium]|nr:hypothetical protein [Burkholderiales bacterium]